MALLNRLFPSRKKQSTQKGYVSPVRAFNQKHFDFHKDQVRVLLFRECERRGRKLLFDSKAVKKVPLSTTNKHAKFNKVQVVRRMETSFVEITNGYGYQYTRPAADVKSLGEMIFGSVAMTFRGSAFKIHTGGSPPFLMITRVSNSPRKKLSDSNLEDSCGSSISSMNEFVVNPSSSSDSKLCHNSGSYPLDVPLSSSLTLGASQFFLRSDTNASLGESSCSRHVGSLEGDSGCYTSSDCSVNGLLPSSSFTAAVTSNDSRKGSGGSLSSLRRRWLRTASTSLDLGSSQSLTKTDSLISSSSLQPSVDEKTPRHTKLGVALIINLTTYHRKTMQDFLLEHGMMLESMTVRLQAAVERAYCRKDQFVSMMVDASCDVEQSIEDLILGPRLSGPIWLSLITGGIQGQQNFASKFLWEMCEMIDMFDTKDSNFFLSTLLTAVLTHHLGWVSTVVPELQIPCTQKIRKGLVSKLSELSKINPYNPFWAQAMDMYGALGHPLKTARTIIMSLTLNKNRHDIIEKLLRVVSYFIRCASIDNRETKFEDTNFSSCLCKYDGSDSLSVSDRFASSSTLQPLGQENSSVQTVYQVTSPDVTSILDKPLVSENSSKSENALHSAVLLEENSLNPPGKPSERGLRRTMSYSCKLSTSSSIQVANSSQCNVSKRSENSTPRQEKSIITDKEEPPVGKVIFVLGENDNLIGLKKNCKNIKNERNGEEQNHLSQAKIHEQPLSFSGSEVESGFSDCESYELSPVRSVSENILCSLNNDKLKNCNDQAVQNKIVCSDQKNGVKGFKPKIPVSNSAHISSWNASSPKLLSVHSAYIDVDSVHKSSSSDVAHLCSLARSFSVNIPVSQQSHMKDSQGALVCVNASRQGHEWHDLKSVGRSEVQPMISNNSVGLSKTHSSSNLLHVSPLKQSPMCKICQEKNKTCHCDQNVLQHHQSVSSICVHCNNFCPHLAMSKCHSGNVCELPLPLPLSTSTLQAAATDWGIAGTLLGGVSSHYIPERVLQGCVPLSPGWELTLKRDLAIDAQLPILDAGIAESVAIVANIDSWEVQLISSHTYVVDRPGTLGVRVGLSQLVANMLESVYHLWKLHSSPDLCLSYLEGRLQELWARSRAMSELLLSTEFCDMDSLTSSLCLEPNDVPLLLAVASIHSPQVTQRYGLSFR